MAFGIFECCLCILLVISSVVSDEYCPKRCICENVASKVKLHCGSPENPIKFIDEIDFGSIAPNIVKLYVYINKIHTIVINNYFLVIYHRIILQILLD